MQTPTHQTKYMRWIGAGLLLAFVFVLNNNKIQSNDTWWHIELGRWMVDNSQVITQEHHSATAMGKPFVAYEWLTQVVFYLMADFHGINLSLMKLIVMLGLSLAFGWLMLRPHWNGRYTFVIALALAYLMAFRAHMRPQLFGMWCTVVLITGFTLWRAKPSIKTLWWVFPSQILWTNFHGSYLLGPCLMIIITATVWVQHTFSPLPGDKPQTLPDNAPKQLALITLGLFIASMINPYGLDLLEKSFTVFFRHNYMKQYIREWYTIIDIEPGYWFFVWLAWLTAAWTLAYKQRSTISTLDLTLLAVATAFPFVGTRYLTLSAMLSFPWLIKSTRALYPGPINPKLNYVLALPLIAYVAVYGNPYSDKEYKEVGVGFHYAQAPLDIVHHIKVHGLKGTIMNHYDDGAYIIYYNYPDVRTVMDSRTELYGKRLFEEHHQAYSSLEHFFTYVNKYKANMIMVQLGLHEILRNYLYQSPDWKLEKVGLTHVLFSRIPPDQPKTSMEHQNQQLQLSAKLGGKPVTALTDDKRFCLFARLYGRCADQPQCATECGQRDEQIAQAFGLPNTMCLKFSQACFKPDSGCITCRSLCDHYRRVYPKLTAQLDFDYPAAAACPQAAASIP